MKSEQQESENQKLKIKHCKVKLFKFIWRYKNLTRVVFFLMFCLRLKEVDGLLFDGSLVFNWLLVDE